MYLSKSKYCKAVQCYKELWLDTYHPEYGIDSNNNAVLDNGTNVGEIAKDLFGFHFDVSFNEDLNMMINDTKALLFNNNVVITEASFQYDNNFCSVDILKKNGNNYEIYEVKSSTDVHDIYIHDVSYQYYVLTSLGYNVSKACVVHLNKDYVRNGELELDKLFVINDLTDKAISLQEEIKNRIEEVSEYVDDKEEKFKDIDECCFDPYLCPYFKYCSGNIKNSVFDIEGMRTKQKVKLYKEGKQKFKDLLDEDILDKYKMQIKYELDESLKDYCELDKIKEFMSELKYPLYFLDFETFQQAIPEYDGISPYDQIPFQYSLHYIEENNGELFHKEFLAQDGIDPRRSLAESLVNDIPLDVCTLAYNMGFEKGVIKKLANLYPDLSDHLMNIHDNINDLIIPFRSRYYYSRGMKGKSSIKYVLPALFPDDSSLDYHNLDLIHNGSEAMNSFANLRNMDVEEKEHVRERLLRYCELDTYAMVKIYYYLKELIEKNI